jgi:hypothetical protein
MLILAKTGQMPPFHAGLQVDGEKCMLVEIVPSLAPRKVVRSSKTVFGISLRAGFLITEVALEIF